MRDHAIDVAVVVAWTVGDPHRLARQVRATRAVNVVQWVVFIDTSRGTADGHDQLERELRALLVDNDLDGNDVAVVRGAATAVDSVQRLIAVLDALPVTAIS